MKTRWIKTTTESTGALKMQVPWERGSRRKAMITRRTERLNRLNLLPA